MNENFSEEQLSQIAYEGADNSFTVQSAFIVEYSQNPETGGSTQQPSSQTVQMQYTLQGPNNLQFSVQQLINHVNAHNQQSNAHIVQTFNSHLDSIPEPVNILNQQGQQSQLSDDELPDFTAFSNQAFNAFSGLLGSQGNGIAPVQQYAHFIQSLSQLTGNPAFVSLINPDSTGGDSNNIDNIQNGGNLGNLGHLGQFGFLSQLGQLGMSFGHQQELPGLQDQSVYKFQTAQVQKETPQECYICMAEKTLFNETCGDNSHQVCSECFDALKRLRGCPMCRNDLQGFVGREALSAFVKTPEFIESLHRQIKASQTLVFVCNSLCDSEQEQVIKEGLQKRATSLIESLCSLDNTAFSNQFNDHPIVIYHILKKMKNEGPPQNPNHQMYRIAQAILDG